MKSDSNEATYVREAFSLLKSASDANTKGDKTSATELANKAFDLISEKAPIFVHILLGILKFLREDVGEEIDESKDQFVLTRAYRLSMQHIFELFKTIEDAVQKGDFESAAKVITPPIFQAVLPSDRFYYRRLPPDIKKDAEKFTGNEVHLLNQVLHYCIEQKDLAGVLTTSIVLIWVLYKTDKVAQARKLLYRTERLMYYPDDVLKDKHDPEYQRMERLRMDLSAIGQEVDALP